MKRQPSSDDEQGSAGLLKREIIIINRLGLHARAAAKFVTLAAGFDAEIRLLRDGREVNGKSIMGVMMLAAALWDQGWSCAPAAPKPNRRWNISKN